jgi:hypothetical protein
LPDFCCPDENFLDIINLRYDEEILKYFYDHNNLVENGVSLYRYTQCTCRPNTYGKRLIELCKKNNIYFVNSKIGRFSIKSPTRAYRLLFPNNEINSFSISVNASIVEYFEFSGGMYTHPNKNSSEKISLENFIH